LKTIQVNPETRPDLFYLPQDKLDANGQAIPILDAEGVDTGKVEQEYTVKAEVDKLTAVDHDIVKRKSAKGIAEFRSYDELTEIWHEIDGKKFKLADHAFYLEYLDGEKWIRSKGSSTQIDEISVEAQDDIIRADVDSETGKYTFTLGKKGYTIRGVWVIRRYDVYDDCFDDLRLDTSDYTGNIEDSDWVDNVRTLVFESKGVKDKLVVDPYLGVEEQSTVINVSTTSAPFFELEFNKDKGGVIDIFYSGEGGATNYASSSYGLLCPYYNGGYKYWGNDTGTVDSMVIIEQSPIRVVIKITTADGFGVTGLNTEWYLYVYSTGVIFSDFKCINNTSSSLGNSDFGMLLITDNTQYDTSVPDHVSDNNSTTSPTYNTEFWYAWFKSGNPTIICGVLESTSNFTSGNVEHDTLLDFSYNRFGYAMSGNSTTISIGEWWRFKNILYIAGTSATESTIEADIAEFHNISTDLTTTGLPITDRNVPATINTTSGFCADGAFHVTSDSNNAGKFTMDRARALFATVIEDWPVMSGDPSSPTEHLLFWDKMDSIANGHSPEEGTGTVTVSGSQSLVDGVKGDAVYSDTSADYFQIATSGNIEKEQGTIEFYYIPNYTGAPSHRCDLFLFELSPLFYVYIDTSSFLTFYCGGNTTNFDGFTTDYCIAGQPVHLKFCWAEDSTDSLRWIIINGKIKAFERVAALQTSLDTTGQFAGRSSSSRQIEGSLDNFKIYDTPILPYGTFIPANIISGDVGYDMAHSDILLYWGCENNITEISSKTVTYPDSDGFLSTDAKFIGTKGFEVVGNGGRAIMDCPAFSDQEQGRVSLWYKRTTTRGHLWSIYIDDDNYIYGRIESDDDLSFRIRANGTSYTTYANTSGEVLAADGWVFLDFRWYSDGLMRIFKNGVECSYDAQITSRPESLVGTFDKFGVAWEQQYNTYSSFGYYDQVTITNNPNTPQLWTANGKPLILPDFKRS